MTWFLASLPTPLLVLLVVGVSVLLAAVGVLIVRRLIPHTVLVEHNDIAGFIFATVGVTYAVIIALVAIGVWEDFQAAESLARREAAVTLDLFREADAFPEANRQEIRDAVREYVRAVVEDEWPAMATGDVSERAEGAIESLWAAVLQIEPETQRESNWHDQTITTLRNLSDAREQRLTSLHSEVPFVVWTVLLLGAALTVGYTYLYGVRRAAVQFATTSFLAALIALVLSLIIALDRPYTGDASVELEPLQTVLDEMERRHPG